MFHRQSSTRLMAIAGAALTLTVAGCGGGSSNSTSSGGSGAAPATAPASGSGGAAAPAAGGPAQSSAKVDISNFKFAPAALVVSTGAKVTFTNHDSAPHTATARDGSFDSGTLNQGQSKTEVLSKPGTYTYYCQFHAFMTATVTVK